ncbi:hypothetical protein G9A89_010011 [Geosiphon pyriformis]|nr:hypothetical protein G9A89_010011 [Geosiphon pyriformis]
MSLEKLLSPTDKPRHPNPISCPQNAYILYRKEAQFHIHREMPNSNFIQVSKIAGKRWRAESPQVRKFFGLLAGVAQLIHDDMVAATENKAAGYRTKKPNEGNEWRRHATLPQVWTRADYPHDISLEKKNSKAAYSVFSVQGDFQAIMEEYPVGPISTLKPSPNSAFKIAKPLESFEKNKQVHHHIFHPYPCFRRVPIQIIFRSESCY